jgi:hypothetical protein
MKFLLIVLAMRFVFAFLDSIGNKEVEIEDECSEDLTRCSGELD